MYQKVCKSHKCWQKKAWNRMRSSVTSEPSVSKTSACSNTSSNTSFRMGSRGMRFSRYRESTYPTDVREFQDRMSEMDRRVHGHACCYSCWFHIINIFEYLIFCYCFRSSTCCSCIRQEQEATYNVYWNWSFIHPFPYSGSLFRSALNRWSLRFQHRIFRLPKVMRAFTTRLFLL